MADLLLPIANPWLNTAPPPYSRGIVEAFVEALKRRVSSNGLLAALGVNELRASGWDSTAPLRSNRS